MTNIALKNQVHIYSCDTKAFYTDCEAKISDAMYEEQLRRKLLIRERDVLTEYYNGNITVDECVKKINSIYEDRVIAEPYGHERISDINKEITSINKYLNESKEKLKLEMQRFDGIREFRQEYIIPSSVISIFESNLTRTLGMQTDQLSDALVIIRVFFFDVFKDLVLNGFLMNGEKYVLLTASAGQIRTKKAVFIKESLWIEHERSIMCGLSIDRINEMGGCNRNKYLAYLALNNSATDVWDRFNIDKAIVVDDMETLVHGVVDHICDKTYDITRREMDVPVTHTDGCGMVLPGVTDGKNMMLRLPWIKGLLASFPFDEFVLEANAKDGFNYGIVTDIYGKKHDVIAEGIEIIFTKSQFKMWKYYTSWEEYKQYFKQYGCTAGICNVEEDQIDNATLTYQMLQSLTDITDRELERMSRQTNYKLNNLVADKKVMLKILGASLGNPNRTPAQECLRIYPELLQDKHYKRIIRDMKDSVQREAWSAALDIYGKYLYVIPDLYAFCEWLFLGDKNPSGLLGDGQVYCAMFPKSEKLDCLRSPHLYREHPVRVNVHDSQDCKRWFSERAIYTSCHDLISKILQFDCDGDKLLVCADRTLVEVAERNMQGIVPLYYEMAKAGSTEINPKVLYEGMITAYVGGNIGAISNLISKIWNSDLSENEKLDLVKWLCMENNFVIDYAKTLYKPERPDDVNERISMFNSKKLPHFFMYAKKKEPYQVEELNNSSVNKLKEIIPKRRIKVGGRKVSKFDYKMLMNNPSLIVTDGVQTIIKKYTDVSYGRRMLSAKDKDEDSIQYTFKTIRDTMFDGEVNPKYVVDSIIYGIFNVRDADNKMMFWGAFGDIVLENLINNLSKMDAQIKLCDGCYNRYDIEANKFICPYCGLSKKYIKMICESCGAVFFSASNVASQRKYCSSCYNDHRKKAIRENALKYYHNHKTYTA